jgi:2-succinyl-6-hydroxy-2,4-cyclohexadiene-1-carboxylate synthase
VNIPPFWTRVGGATSSDSERVLLLHGFTQTARSWHRVADDLHDAEVVAPDLPGHGRSSGVAADLPETARHLAATVGPALIVGYSMGARLALHIAVLHPEAVRGLVLIGATAGLDHDEDRRERRRTDELLAQMIERDGVETFLTTWLQGPLFRDLRPDPEDLAGRLTNTATGLAMSLRRCGTGAQEPLWDRLSGLQVPTMVVAGANDTKFTALGERLASTIGHSARLEVVPDAGHAAHLEQPESFLRLLRRARNTFTRR